MIISPLYKVGAIFAVCESHNRYTFGLLVLNKSSVKKNTLRSFIEFIVESVQIAGIAGGAMLSNLFNMLLFIYLFTATGFTAVTRQ
jgi:hypothetical protein